MLQKLMLMALAGAVGTLARYGLQGLVQNATGKMFPWGTVVVNVSGCLAFGIVWAISENRLSISGDLRAIALVGFMGAFTTFSTYIFETAGLLGDREWMLAMGNFTLQNFAGLAALFLGLAIGRLI